MQPFTVHSGVAVPLDRANVDTDQIISKEYLKRIERTGFGRYLFMDWRFMPDGSPNLSFPLNDPAFAGASILIAGRNFGCGSSREHAVWALYDFGIRAIIAPSFADIFFNNALGNGLLPIVLPEDAVGRLMLRVTDTRTTLTIDLLACEIRDGEGQATRFGLDPFSRFRLLNGLDDIGLTLQHEDQIAAYEHLG
ncbi:MAG: 3-isopropylmalate dehydratase small subunit [Chloroflexota bacterium]